MNRSTRNYSTSNEFVEAQPDRDDALTGADPMQMHLSVPGDDRYPGTFFRVPRMPVPGKTSWSLNP